MISFSAYLKDHWFALLIGAICIASVAVAVLVQGVGIQGALLVCLIVAISLCIALCIDYGRKRRFYCEIDELSKSSDDAVSTTSLLREPSFAEGEAVYEALIRLSFLADQELECSERDARSYREYIEMWIHETKTPIAAAKLALSSMHGEEADRLGSEIERIELQVEQALYYARSTSVARDYSIREISLADACTEAIKKNMRLLIDNGVMPSIEVASDVMVLSDCQWLIFILSQIVVNASKYDATRITFRSRVEDSSSARERTILEVSDDGCGIPASDVPRVFERGFVGANGRSRGKATGLGLYLVAKMCKQLGLDVAIASEEGSGTRVLIAFPHDRRRANLSKR